VQFDNEHDCAAQRIETDGADHIRVERNVSSGKRALWERYVNSLPRVLFNIFAPCLCLTLLAWLIPAIGKSYWTLHASEPGAYTSALIWLTLVLLESIRILRNEYLIRTRKPN
jgi:hypothetical protein